MKELQLFGHISNFKINYTKSELLPINLPEALAANLRQAFPFSWAKYSIKYLGVQLTDRFKTLYSANFLTLLDHLHVARQS